MNPATQESKLFGFVNFADKDAANRICEELNEKEDEGIMWYIKRALSKRERMVELAAEYKKKISDWKRRNLFVKDLDENIDETRLEKLFEDFGEIESTRIVYTSAVYFEPQSNVPQTKKESKGAGFVCFKTPEAARIALQKMNGTPVNNKRIAVTWWLPKEERMKNKRSMPRQPMMPGAMMMPQFYGMQPMGMM